MSETISLRKKLIFTAVLVGLMLLLFEGLARVGLKFISANWGLNYHPTLNLQLSAPHHDSLTKFIADDIALTGFSKTLGWTNKANIETEDGVHITNSIGVRGKREYQKDKPTDKIRVTSFGDSFTYGMEVRGQQTWQQQLEALDPQFETMNFGVGAHGTDQALMRYRTEGADYESDFVVIGFMTENINRILNVYRPFYMPTTGIPVTKPRYQLRGGNLVFIDNPNEQVEDYSALLEDTIDTLHRYGQNDFYYRRAYAAGSFDRFATVRLWKMASATFLSKPTYELNGVYAKDGEGFQLLTAILKAFAQEVAATGATPVVLISPQLRDVERQVAGQSKMYQPLLEWLTANDIEHIDLLPTINAFDVQHVIYDFFSPTRGHYSARGNRWVAQAVRKRLYELSEQPRQRQPSK